jgi:phage shock protein PspC (stress-responsive transcriptional regulator)
MKKNISINISGIIFHIEENGYEKLNAYLESINSYFSNFDDSGEIVADIESRIAEIFLSKLNEGKQVITADDVESLISTMGSIADFQAIEDDEVVLEEPVSAEDKGDKKTTEESKKLYRDSKRKLLGGVAAGMANYFTIDPLWIRLLFILLATDIFFSHSLGFIIIITYIVLWVILPVSDEVDEDAKIKKMYRNPDDRVLGGVASGVAAYFGTDPTLIRVLFVLSIFLGGSGLIVYLILWIILPEATSITDKVQMQGEPVTLENIETNIKKSINVKEDEEESGIVKVLLFPFRLIAMIFRGIGKVLGPLLLFVVEAFRILFGLVLVLMGISGVFTMLVLLGVFLGLFAAGEGTWGWIDYPIGMISEAFPAWGVVMAFVAMVVPAFAVTFIGLSVIAKTKVINATVGWTMFGLWMLSLIGLSFLIPKIAYEFKSEADYEETQELSVAASVIHLDINEVGMDDFDLAELALRGYDGDEIKLTKEFRSFGNSRKNAIENAKAIQYHVGIEDSTIYFDSNITYEEDAKFRFQELDMTLYIPYGQEFTMSGEMRNILKYYSISNHGYSFYDLEDNTWVYNPSGLDCITCFDENSMNRERSEKYRKSFENSFNVNGYYEEFENKDFREIYISGSFEVQIIQNDDFRILLNGSKQDISEVTIVQDEDRLEIEYQGSDINYDRHYKSTKIVIALPSIRTLELTGASRAYVKGFDEQRVTFELKGASEADIDMDAYETIVDLSGASKLEISGTGHEMTADLSAASSMDAYQFRVNDATINASVASSAKVYVKENLDINASIASDIKYRGGAKVKTNRSRSIE